MNDMLVPRYRKKLTQSRAMWATVLLVLIAGACTITYGAIVGFTPLWEAVLFGCTALLVSSECVGVIRQPPAGTIPIFDRPVAASVAYSYPRGKLLTAFGHELDQLATAEGFPALSSFMADRLELGIARHDPAAAIPVIDAMMKSLQRNSSAVPDAQVAAELRLLREHLCAASATGARFCLLPIEAWSGLCEMSLKLFL